MLIWMRPIARSLAASTKLRYGTFDIERPAFLRNAANINSLLPVVPAQLRLPGCARAIATSSATELTSREAGTAMTTMVFETLAIGTISAGVVGEGFLNKRSGGDGPPGWGRGAGASRAS